MSPFTASGAALSPPAGFNRGSLGLVQPFAIVDNGRALFVTGNVNIGTVWVANSGGVDLRILRRGRRGGPAAHRGVTQPRRAPASASRQPHPGGDDAVGIQGDGLDPLVHQPFGQIRVV